MANGCWPFKAEATGNWARAAAGKGHDTGAVRRAVCSQAASPLGSPRPTRQSALARRDYSLHEGWAAAALQERGFKADRSSPEFKALSVETARVYGMPIYV